VNKQKGFSLVEVSVIIAVIAGLVFISSYAVGRIRHHNLSSPSRSSDAIGELKVRTPDNCKRSASLEICLSADTRQAKATDKIDLKTTVKNVQPSTYKYTFSCTYTAPRLTINDKDVDFGVTCGQALTTVALQLGESKTFHREISGSDLKEGSNTLLMQWAEGFSGSITIVRQAVTSNELESQFKACQQQESSDSAPSFCSTLSITLKGNITYTCNQWQKMLDELGLKVVCGDLADIGIVSVFVPKLETEQWINKIKTLEPVDSVNID
jgi:hypothetical protein